MEEKEEERKLEERIMEEMEGESVSVKVQGQRDVSEFGKLRIRRRNFDLYKPQEEEEEERGRE